jgi:hypothetical protein
MLRPILFLSLALLAGCAASPLYVERGRGGTLAEVPRDARGEPIWAAIKPMPILPGYPSAVMTAGAQLQPR